MDDLETTIVITPAIPLDAITTLERLVLSHIFDAGETDGALQLYSDRGAASNLHIPAIELAAAYADSRAVPDSEANYLIGKFFTGVESGGDAIDVDMTGTAWEHILQDIVARSATLAEIRVLEWYRHASQSPDSFGANVTLITANEVAGRNSDDFFEEMRAEAETQRPAEGVRRSPGVPDLTGADPAVTRMRHVIDLQRDGRFPNENFILDTRGQNSLTRIRRFIESFGAPVPAARSNEERKLEVALYCWEAMLDFNGRLMSDRPIVPSLYAMLELWTVVGSLRMRRWATPAADLAIRIHDHLREQMIGPPTPLDHDFVPPVIEVLSWTPNGPELPDTIEAAAVKVLAKLVDYREKRR